MVLFPEREKNQTQENIQTSPEAPLVSEPLENVGVTPTPTAFTAQVTDDAGQNVIAPVPATLQVPANMVSLSSWSKGPITSSLTWFAAFWLRVIKKAIHFGVRIITGNADSS